MTAGKRRSPASAGASRTNGSLSKGPSSLAGRQTSARNSLKHGLFRAGLGAGEPLSPDLAALACDLRAMASGNREAETLVESALDAALRLEQAERLVRRTRAEVAELLGGGAQGHLLARRLDELIRYARYERRLRGRRDRVMRKLMVLAVEPTC